MNTVGRRVLLPTVYSCLIFAILLPFSSADLLNLCKGYYDDKCPGAEAVITEAVVNATANYKGLCAGVIRMHFHDCFVRGCDASILLNDSSNSSPERLNRPNLNLRGFEVIDAAKAAVEAHCCNRSTGCAPVVSCADIIAFAARDCVKILGGSDCGYDVYSGRLDGKVSIAQEAVDYLPDPSFDITQLEKNFGDKGMSIEDLTVLSGAHSIGESHCSSFKDRLNPIDSSRIDSDYANQLKQTCTSDDVTVPQDVTPDSLDNQYYKSNLINKVLFLSDWELRTNTTTQTYMTLFANDPLNTVWKTKFKAAMQKLGKIIELTAGQGEIRKVCYAVNTYS